MFVLVRNACNACNTVATSTMVSLTNMYAGKRGALSNQREFCFWISAIRSLLKHVHPVQLIELSIFALQCDCLSTTVEVTAAVCGFNLYAIWCNYLCEKCLLEDTAASPTMGLFGAEIEQYVVIYIPYLLLNRLSWKVRHIGIEEWWKPRLPSLPLWKHGCSNVGWHVTVCFQFVLSKVLVTPVKGLHLTREDTQSDQRRV
jgi:hypothetical protein